MLYKLSILALAGASYALPGGDKENTPPQYGGTTSTTVEHAPTYGASTTSTTSSVVHPPVYGSSSSSSAPIYAHSSSTTSPSKYSTTSEAPKYSTTASEAPKYSTTASAKCPAPGSYDSQHRYSCNPAHSYPDGQTCELIDGCYFLKHGKTTSSEVPHYSTTSEAPKYTTTASAKCPAPGSYDSQHRYSCNPAHTYPDGQTCELIDGCYFLKHGKTTEVPYYPTSSEAPHYTTKVVTSLTTYCPSATTFTHGPSTYTVTKATTLTLPCPHGCTITKSQPPVYHPTGSIKTSSTVSKPETHKSYPPHETSVIKTTQTLTSTITAFKPTSVPVYSDKGKTYYSTSLTASYYVSTWVTVKTVPAPQPTVAPAPSCPICPVQHCPPAVTVTTTVYASMQPPPTYVAPVPQKPSSQAPQAPPASTPVAPAPPTYVAPPPVQETKSVPAKPVETHPAAYPSKPAVETHPAPIPSKPVETHPAAYPSKPVETHPAAYPSKPVETHPAAYPSKPVETHPAAYPSKPVETHPAAYPSKPVETHPAAYPSKPASCPAPGSYDDKHRYGCNPAHAYPGNQKCESVDGCYILQTPKTSTVPVYDNSTKTVTHPAVYPTTTKSVPVYGPHTTPSCPAPGSTDKKGRYSCNPAHAYPQGQVCKAVDGCYYLEHVKTTTESHPPVYTTKSAPVYKPTTTESHPSYPTHSCPAPGTTDKKGRYSCNPAHAYPQGQVCKSEDGCYYLEHVKTTTESHPPVYHTTTESAPVYKPTTSSSTSTSCTTTASSSSTTSSVPVYPVHPTTTSSLSPPKYETTSSSPPKYETTSSSPPKYETTSSSSPPKYESSTTPAGYTSSTTPAAYTSTTPAAYHSTTPAAYYTTTTVATPSVYALPTIY